MLEVASAGVEKPLTTLEHYKKNIDKYISYDSFLCSFILESKSVETKPLSSINTSLYPNVSDNISSGKIKGKTWKILVVLITILLYFLAIRKN